MKSWANGEDAGGETGLTRGRGTTTKLRPPKPWMRGRETPSFLSLRAQARETGEAVIPVRKLERSPGEEEEDGFGCPQVLPSSHGRHTVTWSWVVTNEWALGRNRYTRGTPHWRALSSWQDEGDGPGEMGRRRAENSICSSLFFRKVEITRFCTCPLACDTVIRLSLVFKYACHKENV